MEALLRLFEDTFGFTRFTYLIVYCIYTGSSVLVKDVRSGDQSAAKLLQTYLRAMNEGVTSCPVIQRSLDIVMNGLNLNSQSSVRDPDSGNASAPEVWPSSAPQPSNAPTADDFTTAHPGLNSAEDTSLSSLPSLYPAMDDGTNHPLNSWMPSVGYLPAFPYSDLQLDFAQDQERLNTNLDWSSFLDCFPENRQEQRSEWYLP